MRVVPSCAYQSQDVSMFNDVSDLAAEAHLTIGDTLALAQQVERALWSGAYHPALEALSSRMPGQLPIQLIIGKNDAAQRRLLTIWRTVLEGLASAPRRSAEYLIAPTPAPVRARRQR